MNYKHGYQLLWIFIMMVTIDYVGTTVVSLCDTWITEVRMINSEKKYTEFSFKIIS